MHIWPEPDNHRGKFMDLPTARTIMAARGWLPLTPEPFRQAVLDHAVLRSFGKGDTVFAPGDDSGTLWGMVAGCASIMLNPQDSAQSVGHPMLPGQWVGTGHLLFGGKRRIEVQVSHDSHLIALSSAAFRQIAADDPLAWRWLGLIPALNGSLAMMTVEDLMIRDSRHRTAASLLRLAGCRGPYLSPEPVEILLTQEALATLINLSRTVLGEILRDFEREGRIERHYGSIRVARDLLQAVLVA